MTGHYNTRTQENAANALAAGTTWVEVESELSKIAGDLTTDELNMLKMLQQRYR